MQRLQRGVSGRRLFTLVLTGIFLAVMLTATGERAVHAAVGPGYNWDDGTVQGWSVDWEGEDPASSPVVARSGGRSLALPVEGREYPGFRSPTRPAGLAAGSVVTFHLYTPRNARPLQVMPYVSDNAYVEHFGSWSRLTPGSWTTLTWRVPSVPSLHHLGLEFDSRGWAGKVYLDDVSWAKSDPRGPLFEAQNLIYGSHIGAWDQDGGTAISNPTAAANVKAAKIRVIKWQMWKPPCELRATDCQTEAQFNAAIDGIRRLGAEPLVGLPPIWDQQCTGAPDAWSRAWQDWIIRTAGTRVKLYELGNEPDHYCAMTGQRYYDELWVHAPTLKAYARSLGHQIFIGGPGWSSSDAASLTELKVWLGAAKAGYLANGSNRDWLPDFISTHTYLITPTENETQANAQARIDSWGAFYDDLQAYVDTTFTGLTDQGYPIADQLKPADTEWNASIELTWPGNDDQVWTDFYVHSMFAMLRGHGVWLSNQSTIASHSGQSFDLLRPDGAAKPQYNSYKAESTSAPRN
jgi:hypothetical protein